MQPKRCFRGSKRVGTLFANTILTFTIEMLCEFDVARLSFGLFNIQSGEKQALQEHGFHNL